MTQPNFQMKQCGVDNGFSNYTLSITDELERAVLNMRVVDTGVASPLPSGDARGSRA